MALILCILKNHLFPVVYLLFASHNSAHLLEKFSWYIRVKLYLLEFLFI